MNERAHEQSRADEQDDPHRHLAGDEQPPRPAALAARDRASAGLGQRHLHVDAARVQRRHEAEEDARHQRDEQRDGKHARIELNGIPDREYVGAQPDQRGQHGPAHDNPESASSEGEQTAFNQQLPDHRPPAAAERHPGRDLPRARPGSREEQPRDIDASDQEHQADRAPQHQERTPDFGGGALLQRQTASRRPRRHP